MCSVLTASYTKANLLLIITSAFATDSLSLLHFLSGSFMLSPESNKNLPKYGKGSKMEDFMKLNPEWLKLAYCARCILAGRQGLNRRSGSCL